MENKKEDIKNENVDTEENVNDKADIVEEEKTEKKSKKSSKQDKSSEELKKLQSDYESLNDKYVRMLAEYDNYRKRTQKDIDSRVTNTRIDVLSKILPVVDNFERAASNSDADYDSYKKGIEMTVNQFNEILKSIGVEDFGKTGDKFDPNIHNGVMHIEDENLDENIVADVFMKGYKIGDKIIRPATVKVAN